MIVVIRIELVILLRYLSFLLFRSLGDFLLFIYLDETTRSNDFHGYGSLMVKDRITRDVVDIALENLASDPDIHNDVTRVQDYRTLKRGYFHACDDSKNAHSHICTSIRNNVVGAFKHHIFTLPDRFKDVQSAYDLAQKLSIISAFGYDKCITFVFERRNDLTEYTLLRWWDALWDDLLKIQHRHPFIPHYYPDFQFQISDKSDPGLQVVDFVLWASTRKMERSSCRWSERISSNYTTAAPSDSSWHSSYIALGHNPFLTSPVTYSIADSPPNTYWFDNSPFEFLTNVQLVFDHLVDKNLTSNIQHLWSDVVYLQSMKDKVSDERLIKKMAEVFLKLFDNINLIQPETSLEHRRFWLSCRKFMSLLLDDSIPESQFHLVRLSDERNSFISGKFY